MGYRRRSSRGRESPLTHEFPSPSDLRDLPPPEPLLRILDRLEREQAGPHVFLLAREPLMLYPLLAGGGWRHATLLDDRGYVLTVYRDAAPKRDPAS